MDQQVVTLANLMTAAGAGIAAVIITGLVQLLKQVFPILNERVSGAAMAFVFSALLYIWAAITQLPEGFDQQVALLISWLTCATAAVGAYSATLHVGTLAGVQALRSPKVATEALSKVAEAVREDPDVTVETISVQPIDPGAR